jgi:hypothetical protein
VKTAEEKSIQEELIGLGWLICALLAWIAGFHKFAWVLFVKSALDFCCSIGTAIVSLREKRKKAGL